MCQALLGTGKAKTNQSLEEIQSGWGRHFKQINIDKRYGDCNIWCTNNNRSTKKIEVNYKYKFKNKNFKEKVTSLGSFNSLLFPFKELQQFGGTELSGLHPEGSGGGALASGAVGSVQSEFCSLFSYWDLYRIQPYLGIPVSSGQHQTAEDLVIRDCEHIWRSDT